MIRFSVITAVKDGAATLPKLIDSVLGQTCREVELVVKDGGSTDGTIRVLEARHADIAYWESNPDTGIYQAWNRALAHASGDWVIFLGADDYLYAAEVLERVATGLNALPESAEIAYGRLAVVTRDGRPVEELGMPWPQAARRLAQVMSLPHPAVFYRRSVFARAGGFDETFRIAGDYEFLLRALRGREAHFLPEVTVSAMRAGGASLDPSKTWTVLAETYRARRLNVSPLPAPLWLWAVAKVCVRTLLLRVLGERLGRRCLDALRRVAGRPPYWTLTE
jgi:glycosyltransferase involved in cell wall biosynthesis